MERKQTTFFYSILKVAIELIVSDYVLIQSIKGGIVQLGV